jgi:hypothetical protein
MRKIISYAIILFALASCGNKKKSSSSGVTKDTAATKPVVVDNTQKVTYKSATYYTGRVDFYFTDEKGEVITVGISNLPEDSGAVYPAYLLESTENLEGPPGENPAMVGKPFLLIKNAAGEVREIKPAN